MVIFHAGWGSGGKQQGKQCPHCKSTNLIYLDKFYARCRGCGRVLSRSALRRQ